MHSSTHSHGSHYKQRDATVNCILTGSPTILGNLVRGPCSWGTWNIHGRVRCSKRILHIVEVARHGTTGRCSNVYYTPGQIIMFLHFNFVDEPIWFDELGKKKKKKKGKNKRPLHDEEALKNLDAENRQVKKLVWYTKSDQEDHYRGLLRMEDNSTKDIALYTEWCDLNFNPLFLELVNLSSRRWRNKKKWVPIPAGSSRDGLVVEPTDLIDSV
jgi:hypothetical protein